MAKTEFGVRGMTCQGCERAITNALQRVEGVQEVQVDRAQERVAVTADRELEMSVLQTAVEDAGYTFVPPVDNEMRTLT